MATDELRKTKTPSEIDTAGGKGIVSVKGEGLLSNQIESDPRKEYIAAPGALWYGPYVRTLPQWTDDIGRDFGNDIHDRMLLDPQVFKCLNDLRVGILENGYQIQPVEDAKDATKRSPRVGKAARQSSPRATEIADFCRRVLDNLDRPFDDVLFEMLNAMAFGNKMAELVYDIKDSGSLKGKLVLRDIRPKDRNEVAFVVDSFNNILGVMGFIPGVAWPVMPLSIMTNPEKMPNILPREKFAILSHRMQNGDPRGSSILRPAYNGWWLKMQTWGEILKWAVQSAGSSLVGVLPEKAIPVQLFDAQGNPMGDPIEPADAMMMALQAVQNGSVSVFPYGSGVLPLPVNHESGKAFVELIRCYNGEIANAILGQTLATEEGEHMARAASDNHADVMSQIKLSERTMLCAFIRREILRPLVKYNYPDAEELVPSVTMGATDADDFADDLTALTTAGYTVDESQFEALDDLIGMPKRADDWQERKAQADAEKLKAKITGAQSKGSEAAKFADDAVIEESKSRRIWSFWRKEPTDVKAV